jgi:hypothetical protein
MLVHVSSKLVESLKGERTLYGLIVMLGSFFLKTIFQAPHESNDKMNKLP